MAVTFDGYRKYLHVFHKETLSNNETRQTDKRNELLLWPLSRTNYKVAAG